MVFTSCNSNDDSQPSNDEPLLIENYYFRGILDGQELNIEKKIYESSTHNDPNAVSIDFGGSQTNGTSFCYGRYACGLLFYDYQDNPDQLDTAKMYFSRIPVGECTIENERIAMKDFFALTNFVYETYPGNDVNNNVALDFFPAEYENQEVYYSSRFGDNTDASFEIASTTEIDNGVFIVEGNFSCKLYKFKDETDYKELKNGAFKIKISNNLEE